MLRTLPGSALMITISGGVASLNHRLMAEKPSAYLGIGAEID